MNQDWVQFTQSLPGMQGLEGSISARGWDAEGDRELGESEQTRMKGLRVVLRRAVVQA